MLEIRKRIMDLTQKFDRGVAAAGKKRRGKKDDGEQWKGAEDVEKLSAIFMTYLTSPSNFVKQDGEESPATQTNAERAAAEAAANNP